MMDDKGRCKGFGFVSFETADDATKAVTEMHLKVIKGKPLYVGLAEKREARLERLRQRYAPSAGGGMGGMPGGGKGGKGGGPGMMGPGGMQGGYGQQGMMGPGGMQGMPGMYFPGMPGMPRPQFPGMMGNPQMMGGMRPMMGPRGP